MGLRLLAVITDPGTTGACLALAQAAGQNAADIEALHIAGTPGGSFASAEEVALQGLRTRREGGVRERASDARNAFERWMAVRGKAEREIRWKLIEGAVEQALTDEASGFDAVVMSRPTNLDGADALYAALFRARRPVLLAPPAWVPPETRWGKRPVIAWQECPLCLRAVAAARPWLDDADQILAVVVGRRPASIDPLRAVVRPKLPSHLLVVSQGHRPVHQQVLEAAAAWRADVIVIGAFSFGWPMSAFVGRTTRAMIARTSTPLLMFH